MGDFMRNDSLFDVNISTGFYKVDESLNIIKGHTYEVSSIDSTVPVNDIKVVEQYDGLYRIDLHYGEYTYGEMKQILPNLLNEVIGGLKTRDDVIDFVEESGVTVSTSSYYNYEYIFDLNDTANQSSIGENNYIFNGCILLYIKIN